MKPGKLICIYRQSFFKNAYMQVGGCHHFKTKLLKVIQKFARFKKTSQKLK